MKRNLFVIEGTDGSGKSTQFELLRNKLQQMQVDFKTVRFPRYDQESSALLRMYLSGAFAQNPNDVNPYAASTFFAVDRYASYMTDWKDAYCSGVPVLCDRYTTSNAIHQASKLECDDAADAFLQWLFDYEYRLLQLPEPTAVFFLDMPEEYALALLQKRQGDSGDIHEKDHAYLAKCREKALRICKQYGWHRINCVENGVLRSAEAIHRDICNIIFNLLGV